MVTALLPAGTRRLTYDLAAFGLPEVPLFGVHDAPRAREGLDLHEHPGAMEICYLVKGECVFRVAGRDCRMTGNTLFWTLAGEEHSSGRHPYGKGLLYWLQLRQPWRGSFLALTPGAARPLLEGLRTLPRRLYPGARRMKPLFERLFRACAAPSSPLGRLELAAGLVEWLRLVVECSRLARPEGPSPDIRKVLDLVAAEPGRNLSVTEMAAAAGLSVPRLKAKFREQVGLPPGEHALRLKVERARELLAAGGRSVTDVAYALGFSSSQYFATVFKRYTHTRPSGVARRPGDG